MFICLQFSIHFLRYCKWLEGDGVIDFTFYTAILHFFKKNLGKTEGRPHRDRIEIEQP